jgi:hypothetical protein
MLSPALTMPLPLLSPRREPRVRPKPVSALAEDVADVARRPVRLTVMLLPVSRGLPTMVATPTGDGNGGRGEVVIKGEVDV